MEKMGLLAATRHSGNAPPSWSKSVGAVASPIFVQIGRPRVAVTLVFRQHAAVDGVLAQRLLQQFAPSKESTHHGSHRTTDDLGDLSITEFLKIGQNHDHAEIDRQLINGAQNVVRKK